MATLQQKHKSFSGKMKKLLDLIGPMSNLP